MANRKLKVPAQVIELKWSYDPGITGSHRQFVAYPLTVYAEPVSCLTIIDAPGTRRAQWLDSIVLLPFDCPYKVPQTFPEVAAALGLINNVCAKAIRTFAGVPFIDAYAANSWMQPPFSCKEDAKRALDVVLAKLQKANALDHNMRSAIESAVKSHFVGKPSAKFWTPLSVGGGLTALEAKEDWVVLMRWDRWEKEGCTLENRHSDFCREIEENVRKDAFRKRLEYLHLKAETNRMKAKRLRVG